MAGRRWTELGLDCEGVVLYQMWQTAGATYAESASQEQPTSAQLENLYFPHLSHTFPEAPFNLCIMQYELAYLVSSKFMQL
jgi:hypothetical protein